MTAFRSRPAASSGSWGATGLCVSFGGTRALDDITMTAVPGVITAVVGGDGAGKTTLLRCLAGALAPGRGAVSTPGAQAIGYFPASSGTYPDLTVAENLAFRATAYGLRGPTAVRRTDELVELADLAAARDRPAGQLSGGMRQKLGVIAAMLHGPSLLILDEPSTGVDPVSRSGLWWLITRAAADGAAVVLSTTYLDDAQRSGSVLVLDAGRRLASGSPQQIVADMQGLVLTVAERPSGSQRRFAWRRGGGWRVWVPPAAVAGHDADHAAWPQDGRPVAADLQDAVTVAALVHEAAGMAAAQSDETARTAGAGRPAARERGAEQQGKGTGRRPGQVGPLAQCVAVTCRFGQFTAVREVSLQIQRGEVVGLLGANGAGKTTLIRTLLGLQRATAGTVALLGERPSRPTRRYVGYVPQGLGLYTDLTVAQNLEFAAAVFGSPRARWPAGTTGQQALPIGSLPLGLQRRTAFAQALAHDPDLLILDEPTSGVDPLGRARLWDTIASTARAGAGVLVSTHYMEEAGECDRLVIMANGAVVATGTEAEIIGAAQVTVVETANWATAFGMLAAAGWQAALTGGTLRVPGASQAEVATALSGIEARLYQAKATLEERFFELASGAGGERVPA